MGSDQLAPASSDRRSCSVSVTASSDDPFGLDRERPHVRRGRRARRQVRAAVRLREDPDVRRHPERRRVARDEGADRAVRLGSAHRAASTGSVPLAGTAWRRRRRRARRRAPRPSALSGSPADPAPPGPTAGAGWSASWWWSPLPVPTTWSSSPPPVAPGGRRLGLRFGLRRRRVTTAGVVTRGDGIDREALGRGRAARQGRSVRREVDVVVAERLVVVLRVRRDRHVVRAVPRRRP